MGDLLKNTYTYPTWLAPIAGMMLLISTILAPSAHALSTVTAKMPKVSTANLKSKAAVTSAKKTLLRVKVKSLSQVAPFALKAKDQTNTKKMKSNKALRAKVTATVWASSWTATKIAFYESRDNCKAVGQHGYYRGKWQMDPSFWATYGGLKFAKRPDLATCSQQDIVAYNGWVSRHYQPWQTYSVVNNLRG